MTANDIADVLESIAQLLELQGENPFKIRAYNNAARVLPSAGLSSDDLRDLAKVQEVDGVGKAIAEKIVVLAETGRLEYYEKLKEAVPPGLFDLFEVQGLGAKKIRMLYDKLQVASLGGLQRACEDGRVAALPGFGQKTAQNILRALEDRKKNAGMFSIFAAHETALDILERLRALPEINRAEVAGSFRRRKELVRDLDFIVSSKHPEIVSEAFVTYPEVETVLARGDTKSSVLLKNGIQCDLRVVAEKEYPFALNYFTGSKEHNVVMRQRALTKGWSLNEYRFSIAEGRKRDKEPPEVNEEADIYHALGLDYIPPELRENLGEFAAAESRTLPKLVEWENLRGTFHCHTTASDGRATLDEMATAAEELGLQYLGIADHSKSSFQANGLDEVRLARQREEIAERNARSDGLRIFSGVECDILKDGSLDFDDDVLASLDYVVASIHNAFSLGEADMTKRIIRAMENPHVTMLGHVSGRLLLTREPYAVNIPAIIEAAAETGTIIELNANPRRLELDWRWWPMAIEKGVLCSINPDAHSTNGLQDLYFGVGVARKGWLTRNDVINCLPLGKIESALNAKRAR